jgi:tetratricopeptide (TPR) repeat protein
MTAVAVAVALLAGVPAWVFLPIDPVTVAVMPVVNRTGFTQLDGFAFALQEELAATLHTSPGVRRGDAGWIREIIRPFRDKDSATGVEALEAVRRQSGGAFVLVSSLSSAAGGWTGRIEVQDSKGATLHTLSAGPIAPELLPHDAAYQLTRALAAAAETQFARQGPLRGRVRTALRHWWSGTGSGRFGSLAAAGSFERGLDAYERLELKAASDAFTEAAKQDPRSPLIEAWRSRTAQLMGRDADAVDAAGRIALLPDGSLSTAERLFVDAVAAEAAKDFPTAGARYEELVALDEREWIAERAAYLDRRTDDDAAILAWQRAIELGDRSGRPSLELCRLNGPTRKNNAALALQHADEASSKYAAVGSAIGEAQVAMCRADVLRTSGKREEARRSADQARAILQEANAPYQLPRALYYVGLTANAQQRFAEALEVLTAAQRGAASAGNGTLEPFILQTLGETHLRLGDRRRSIEVNRAAADLFAAQGQVERAASTQTNAGSLQIQFGDNPVEGFRLLENAVGIFRKSGSPNNELFALQSMAYYHRTAGRYTASDRLLAEALALSKQADLPDRTTSLQLDQARVRSDLGDYEHARALVLDALQVTEQRFRIQAEIQLAQIETRAGEFGAARARLAAASSANDPNTRLLNDAALGELEYELDRLDAARRTFRSAARQWGADLPHERAVEASAYAGFLEGNASDVQRSLDRARQTGRVGLEARSRVFLARLALAGRRFRDALEVLEDVPADDGERTIGPELRAQVQYWSAVALRGLGETARADAALADARRLLESIRIRLPEPRRAAFATRADIRRVFE